jgi:hypothetical protein
MAVSRTWPLWSYQVFVAGVMSHVTDTRGGQSGPIRVEVVGRPLHSRPAVGR